MINVKHFALLSVVLMSACAPRSQGNDNELSLNYPPPAATQSAEERKELQTDAGDNKIAKVEPDDEGTVSAVEKAAKNTKIEKNTGKLAKNNGAAQVGNAAAKSISSWQISGAMAARSKNKAWSASINWMQRGANSYQIRLFGPLGSGTIIIQKQGGVVSFRDGAKSASSANAEQLLLRQTGVRLPVHNLYYWVRGIAAPGNVQGTAKDASGHLSILRQGGYTIQYLGYMPAGNTYLPSQIKLQGNGVFIKLVIKHWGL